MINWLYIVGWKFIIKNKNKGKWVQPTHEKALKKKKKKRFIPTVPLLGKKKKKPNNHYQQYKNFVKEPSLDMRAL